MCTPAHLSVTISTEIVSFLPQGENHMTVSLTGPGVIFIQSLPFYRLSKHIARYNNFSSCNRYDFRSSFN